MLIISCYIDTSPIHGIGLFAGEDIPEGTLVWRYNSNFDIRFSRDEFIEVCSGLNHHALLNLLTYAYKRDNYFYYVTDNARFINHSEKDCNLIFRDDYTEVSSRDINKGEEFLENYRLNYDSDDYFFHEEFSGSPEEYLKRIRKQ
jgi:uncharacterized protein